MDHPRAERSAATPLLLGLVVLFAAAALAVLNLGALAVQAERAQATADVAVLTAAVSGGSSAEEVARANGAQLLEVARGGASNETWMVAVARDGARASAAARAQ
ncbi:MAG: pilus assembly protein TadG-related protein [Microthrixaceae bacterium]